MAQVFSCELSKIFKNTFFTENLRETASEIRNLGATSKDYWNSKVSPLLILLISIKCYAMKYLNTQHILFLNNENSENKVSFF